MFRRVARSCRAVVMGMKYCVLSGMTTIPLKRYPHVATEAGPISNQSRYGTVAAHPFIEISLGCEGLTWPTDLAILPSVIRLSVFLKKRSMHTHTLAIG